MNQVVDILQEKRYQFPKELIFNYKKLNITEKELIIILYLINQDSNIYNPKQISLDLKLDFNTTLETINSLCDKNVISIDLDKKNNVRSEVINLSLLYEKLFFSLTEKEEEKDSNLYTIFEQEFGRTLSPMEYEIINGWLDMGSTEEIIKLALKEATYNGVSNLRYIDRIIFEWNKKGIKTPADIEKNRKSKTVSNPKLFEYDWLNEE